jgi:hypothetical protein
LIDDHGLKVAEEIRQPDDALGNIFNLSFPLLDHGIIGVEELLL